MGDRVRRLGLGPYGLAALLGVLALAQTVPAALDRAANPQYELVLYLVALLTTLPLALPGLAAAVVVTGAVVLSLVPFDSLTLAGGAALLTALYRVGEPVPATLLALPFPVLALTRPSFLTVLLASLAPAAAWMGVARRARGEALTHAAARQAIAGSLLEHTARGERARIARELHDVVAHHISMIAVQAETARLTTPGLPPAGAHRLSEIGDTARAGLTEMRRLLGVLREDVDDPVAERRPQPGLRELNELLDSAREASGAGLRLILCGPPSTLDPGVELAAYRIVQEALTNARRHAPGAAVDVELHYAKDVLRLRIRDNGPGPSSTVDGHGLLGMRERAVAVGGTLRTGRTGSGGFVVEASLPVGSSGEVG